MGCWGITAFESDTGVDTVDFIRSKLPENGVLELEKIIEEMRQKEWCVPEVTDLASHTGPMALAEMIVKFQDEDISDMDYDGEWAANQNKFSKVKSFTVTGESVQWLRNYLDDALGCIKEEAELAANSDRKWGGWFEEEDWNGWQEHMSMLISRMDSILMSQENELIPSKEQTSGPVMGEIS